MNTFIFALVLNTFISGNSNYDDTGTSGDEVVDESSVHDSDHHSELSSAHLGQTDVELADQLSDVHSNTDQLRSNLISEIGNISNANDPELETFD